MIIDGPFLYVIINEVCWSECCCGFVMQVAHDTLWGLRMVIFCRSDVASRVSDVETLTVKTGVANKLGKVP